MRKKICLLIICIILSVMVARCLYQLYIGEQLYSGIVIAYREFTNGSEYRIINPNNLSEYVLLDFTKIKSYEDEIIYNIQFDNHSVYIVTGCYKTKAPYEITKISGNKVEKLPVKFPYGKHAISTYLIQDYLLFAFGSEIYFIDKDDYQTTLVSTNSKETTKFLPYKKGVIITNRNNEIVYLEKSKEETLLQMKKEYILKGWYEEGKSFLIYDEKEEKSIVVDLQGREIKTYGTQPYRVIGNMEANNILLVMEPKGPGGGTELDFEHEWWDLLREDHRLILIPYIYNKKNENVVNINIKGEYIFYKWQNVNFDKEYFMKLSEFLKVAAPGQ